MKKLIALLITALFATQVNSQTFRGSSNSFQSFITENPQIVQAANVHQQTATANAEIVFVQSINLQQSSYAKDGVIQEEIVAGVIQEELNAGRKADKSGGKSNLISNVIVKVKRWFTK